MNTTLGIDGTSCKTIDAIFPIPQGYALCCPSCGVWKMRQELLADHVIWRCLGPRAESDFSSNIKAGKGIGAICGKIYSHESILDFIALQMVEE